VQVRVTLHRIKPEPSLVKKTVPLVGKKLDIMSKFTDWNVNTDGTRVLNLDPRHPPPIVGYEGMTETPAEPSLVKNLPETCLHFVGKQRDKSKFTEWTTHSAWGTIPLPNQKWNNTYRFKQCVQLRTSSVLRTPADEAQNLETRRFHNLETFRYQNSTSFLDSVESICPRSLSMLTDSQNELFASPSEAHKRRRKTQNKKSEPNTDTNTHTNHHTHPISILQIRPKGQVQHYDHG
jgi:hypothetical protein